MRSENDVKAAIKGILKPYEYTHVWMAGASQFGVTGQHDFMVCQRGRFWTIEAKFGTNYPKGNQVTFARKIQKAGGLCVVINENNLSKVQEIADYVDRIKVLPLNLNDDFATWRPADARKK